MPTFTNFARPRLARPMLVLALGAALALASGCGSDKSLPTGPDDVSGTYSLRTIDGSSLPFTVPNGREHTIVVNTVTATLNANNTYAVAGTGTEDGNANTVITDNGTYSYAKSGATIHFTSTPLVGATYSASAKTDSFTVVLPGGFVDSNNGSFSLLFVKEN